MPITLLIADEFEVVRAGLKSMVAGAGIKVVAEMLTAVQNCGAGIVSWRSNFAAHRCAARENRDDSGVSHHLSQIRREAQECTLTWSFGPRSVVVC